MMNVQAMKRNAKNEKGLTLIELLAVIVILGIIAAIAIPAVGGIIQKSKEDAVKSEAIQVLNGAKLWVSSNGVDNLSGLNPVNTLTMGDLDSYVDDVKGTYEVTVDASKPKVDYKITSTATGDPKVEITFENATLEDINSDTGKGKRTIP